MNKNRKLIKFQRKQILVSNPVVETEPNTLKPSIKQSQQTSNSQFSNYPTMPPPVADKLQIPRQMRIQNIPQNLKNKFVSMMDAQPIIKVDTLFQNQIVCQITGNVAKNNRESFGKKNKPRPSMEIQNNNSKQILNDFKFQEEREILMQPMFYQENFETNYLDLISQGIPIQGATLESAFQSESNYQGEWNLQPQFKKTSFLPSSNYRQANNRSKFDILPFE